MDIPAQDSIVQVVQDAPILRCVAETFSEAPGEGMNGASEQKGSEWVALLDASGGFQEVAAENQVRVLTVEPLSPSRELREALSEFIEGDSAVNCIESIAP